LFEEESWRAVAHNFAHLLLNYNYPPAEGWFDEGLAEYFSSIRVDNRQVEIGSDPELNPVFTTDLLENQHEAQSPPKSLTELLGAQVWISLPDLFTMKHDTSTYSEGTHHTLFYAQSWMVMHYLLHEKKLPETGTYFDLVENQHLPVAEAIQKAYGTSVAQLDQAIKDYFHSLTPLFVALDASKQPGAQRNAPQVYQFPVPVGPDDNTMTSKPMREADAHAFVGGVKVRIPERRQAGLQELKTLATTPSLADSKAAAKEDKEKENKKDHGNKDDNDTAPLISAIGNEVAHRALAWDHIQHSEFDAAAEELSDAAALDQRDLWIRYYLCVLKYRIAQTKHTDIQGLPNMMQDLRAVLDWRPEFAAAYDLMAMARMEGGGSMTAMQSERAAIQQSPRNQEYLYHLGEIYVSAKKWDAAKALFDRLKTSGNPQVAAAARGELDRLTTEQKYGISAASATASQKLAPQKSPFDVLEEDAAKRAAAQQSAQNSGPADRRPSKFVHGRLVSVDCSQSPGAVLTVTSGTTVLKLRTADYKSLLLLGADTFSCAWNDRTVLVNYKPGGAADGDLVSLEMR